MSEFFISEFGLTVLLGIAVFTSVIFLLVIVLNVLSDLWLPQGEVNIICLLYTSPSPRDGLLSRMPSSA